MLRFKCFDTAAITISGIELAEKIKKVQFKIGRLPIGSATAPEFWTLLASRSSIKPTCVSERSQPRIFTRTLFNQVLVFYVLFEK